MLPIEAQGVTERQSRKVYRIHLHSKRFPLACPPSKPFLPSRRVQACQRIKRLFCQCFPLGGVCWKGEQVALDEAEMRLKQHEVQ